MLKSLAKLACATALTADRPSPPRRSPPPTRASLLRDANTP